MLMLTFGVVFVDLDLDGYVDLVTGNGHIEPEINTVQQDITFAQRPQVFLNTGESRFIDVSRDAGPAFRESMVARGIAYADIDLDGDSDLLFTVNGGAPKLLRNDVPGKERNWIGLSLKGSAPNTQAIGATAAVYTNDLVQRRMVRTGSSYLSQSYLGTLLFGLGDMEQADSIIIRWPTSGETVRLGPVMAGQRYSVSEGNGKLEPITELKK
jgi:hypothetical protein